MSLLQINDLFFHYHKDDPFNLNIPSFSIESNNRAFIEGPSGCGKTTFLNLITGLTMPIRGSITVLGTDITSLNPAKRDRFRADHFGIIFQLFNLIPYLSVVDNIILPCTFSRLRNHKVRQDYQSLENAAVQLCNELDIDSHLMTQPVQHLSIGQQQRVAIARALIGQPEIIVADEPTSALDNDRKNQFMDTLLRKCEEYNISLIFVSHDLSLKSEFNYAHCLNELNCPLEAHHELV